MCGDNSDDNMCWEELELWYLKFKIYDILFSSSRDVIQYLHKNNNNIFVYGLSFLLHIYTFKFVTYR